MQDFRSNLFNDKSLDRVIQIFSELAKAAKEENIMDGIFIGRYLTDSALRPYLKVLYNALEKMEEHSISQFESISREGISFIQNPRQDFFCHEESCREMLYTFATGENKFSCGLGEGLENIVHLLYNYRAILEFEGRKG